MAPSSLKSKGGRKPELRGVPAGVVDTTHVLGQEAYFKQKVTDYLLKRGFTKTEAVFRQESRNLGPDGKPVHVRVEDLGAKQYTEAFNLLRDWIEKNLDIYKVSTLFP